jgi:hypothetical protein
MTGVKGIRVTAVRHASRWGLLAGVPGAAALLLAGCGETAVAVVPVATVSVEPDPVVLVEGESLAPVARVRGPSGQLLNGRTVSWSTDHPSVARIEAGSTLRGEGVGETLLRARVEGLEASASVSVLQGPTLALAPAAFALSGRSESLEPALAAGALTNAGGGSLSGLTVTVQDPGGGTPPPWLQASLDAGTAPTTLRVRAELSELAPGRHEAQLHLVSPVARNSPLVVPLTLELSPPPPTIGLAPATVAFASAAGSREPASQNVAVTNTGGGVLGGLAASITYLEGAPGWLTGVIAATTAPTTLALEATARDLQPDTYRARVRVTAPGAEPASADVLVTFNVAAGVTASVAAAVAGASPTGAPTANRNLGMPGGMP